MKVRVVLIPLTLVALGCSDAGVGNGTSSAGATVRDSAGVVIVENPADTATLPVWRVIVGDNHVLGVHRDDLDVERVRLHRLVRASD